MNSMVLVCHPDTPFTAVRQVSASVKTGAGGRLAVTYVLKGDLDRVRITGESAAGEALWQHTCFELFVGATNDAEYYEFNFSPSGMWALYGFRDYRDGAPFQIDGLELKITVDRKADELSLNAEIPLGDLPGVHSGVQLSLGLSAVVEEIAGKLSYWAIKHPPGRPDFHHADGFAIQIELPLIVDRDRDCAANA